MTYFHGIDGTRISVFPGNVLVTFSLHGCLRTYQFLSMISLKIRLIIFIKRNKTTIVETVNWYPLAKVGLQGINSYDKI